MVSPGICYIVGGPDYLRGRGGRIVVAREQLQQEPSNQGPICYLGAGTYLSAPKSCFEVQQQPLSQSPHLFISFIFLEEKN